MGFGSFHSNGTNGILVPLDDRQSSGLIALRCVGAHISLEEPDDFMVGHVGNICFTLLFLL